MLQDSSPALKFKKKEKVYHEGMRVRAHACVLVRACVPTPRTPQGRGKPTGSAGEDAELSCNAVGKAPDAPSCWPEPGSQLPLLPFAQKCLQSCYCFPQVTNATGRGQLSHPGAQLLPAIK